MGRDVFIKRCAVCHHENSGTRAPLPSVLRQMSSQEILKALRTGVMRAQGSELSAHEQIAVARFLGRRRGAAPQITKGFCAPGPSPLLRGSADWNGWGNGAPNARFQPGEQARLDPQQVSRLRLKWAFGFQNFSVAEPTVFGGRVLVGSAGGNVYSLDARRGCIEWIFKASSGVRAAISVSADGKEAYVGDDRADVFAISTASGALIWKTHIDPHPLATITGAPLLLKGRLYVPVSSTEEGAAVNPYYSCCTFRGSLVALDAATGKQIWKAYTIPVTAKRMGRNAVGIPTWGPSGAAVWSTPTADLLHRAIYVGTGNNYSSQSGRFSDAILAFGMDTGRLLWSQQMTPGDRYTNACLPDSSSRINCPPGPAQDYDFGASPILVSLRGGRSLILAAQKSGMVYALNPRRGGEVVWKRQIANGGALGGVEWGGAAAAGQAYFPISDWKRSVPEAGGGLVALRAGTGEEIWHAPPFRTTCQNRPGCSAAQIAAVTLIPGVVFSGSMDGHLRAYDTRDGRVIWDFNTAQEFKTLDGIAGHGGSIYRSGPVVAGGMLYVESSDPEGMGGNVLLAFSVGGR